MKTSQDPLLGAVAVTDYHRVGIVTLSGYHDLESGERVRAALSHAVEAGKPFAIDLSYAAMLDSTVLGCVITAHARGEQRGVRVVIVTGQQTRPVVRNLLRATGIASSIDIHPTIEAAVRALRAGQEPN